MSRLIYEQTPDYAVEFEDITVPGGQALAVHCEVVRWSPSVKKALRDLLLETYGKLRGQPFYAFSTTDKLSKFIRIMGGRKVGTADTKGLGYAEVFMFQQEVNHG